MKYGIVERTDGGHLCWEVRVDGDRNKDIVAIIWDDPTHSGKREAESIAASWSTESEVQP